MLVVIKNAANSIDVHKCCQWFLKKEDLVIGLLSLILEESKGLLVGGLGLLSETVTSFGGLEPTWSRKFGSTSIDFKFFYGILWLENKDDKALLSLNLKSITIICW